MPCKSKDYKLADRVVLLNQKADYTGRWLKVYEIVVMGVPVEMLGIFDISSSFLEKYVFSSSVDGVKLSQVVMQPCQVRWA